MAIGHANTDHDEIRRWVEERGGRPARVAGTGDDDDPGILRIDFPGFGRDEDLEPISWERFFDKFEQAGLAMICGDDENSRFSKLVSRETVSR